MFSVTVSGVCGSLGTLGDPRASSLELGSS